MFNYPLHHRREINCSGKSILDVPPERESGFSRVDLGVVVGVLALLGLLMLSAGTEAQGNDQTVLCMNNLKQIFLAFKTFSIDNDGRFPMALNGKDGGSREFVAGGNAFRHFQTLSNELDKPNVLICPADDRKPAIDFTRLVDTNVSYFVGVDANSKQPRMWMAGDRNLTVNGLAAKPGLISLKSTETVGWGEGLHNRKGNLLTTQPALLPSVTEPRLALLLRGTGTNINRLAIP